MPGNSDAMRADSKLFEIARVLVRFDHVARDRISGVVYSLHQTVMYIIAPSLVCVR